MVFAIPPNRGMVTNRRPARRETLQISNKGFLLRTLSPNFDAFNSIRGSLSINQFAQTLGADRATVYRVLNGTAAPGPRFIAQVLTELPYRFEHLFTVVDTEAGE